MRLLIITQKVDSQDPILGFFHGWIEEFSKHCESVIVICLQKGVFNLPRNVQVFSLGKERGVSKIGLIFNFYKLIWRYKNGYDAVFIHMNQIYLILGGIFWKLWHKKIALWYVHRQKSLSLWLGTLFVDRIFTSTPASFTLKSHKVMYIGHGVDSSKFSQNVFNRNLETVNIVHIGRITKIKNLEILILAGEILKKKTPHLNIELYGEAMNDTDKLYLADLKNLIKEKSLKENIVFRGPISNSEIGEVFSRANLSVNLTPDGGWDKVVIESLMAYCPVFASNLGLKHVFGKYADKLMFEYRNSQDLAYKIENFLALENRDSIIQNLHDRAVREYDFKNLMKKISLDLAS